MAKAPIVTFRLDEQTYALVEKLAAARGQSAGAMAREMLLESLRGGVPDNQTSEVEVLRHEVRALRGQISKGVELLARLMFRSDPSQRSEAEEGPASWVQRELPR